MSALFFVNFAFLQWFGVRVSLVSCPACRSKYVACKYHRRWLVLRWVAPLTGWWSEYRWIGRPR